MKKKLYDLMNRRTALIQQAEDALNANNHSGYQSAMEQITNLNQEITDIQALIAEQDRQMLNAPAPTGSEAEDIAHERVSALMRGDEVTFTVNEVRRALHNQVTVATGTIVQPTGVGTDIRDPLGNVVPSIVDRVRTLDLTGLGSWQEPYVITELDAKGGKVETTAGTARPTSTDPTFGVAEIKPYELTVTTFVDRNIARLSPTAYYEKIQGMAMRAMRRSLGGLIVTGDDPSTPVFYGITTAKNKAGANIFAEAELGAAVDVNTLDALYFAYGSDEAMGAGARLLLTKPTLKALGALRGTNEKQRLLEITPDPTNPNSGTIRDGGVILPYDLVKAVGNDKILYGDPTNFEVGLFGDYTIRLDESVKAVERMVTILGDAFVGGNLVVDKGFVVGKLTGGAG
ncbi:MAG TPA: phage major capsid protein [Candidatus Avoscillospira avistercoris]|uniref:Phage major capsid protein n=1 Tax=Candidatus Avoscillospira avistercoris TaxID=2840707 RepID=A0A9D1F9Z4_9FIRM|nr:phage major capsid protein [Candidatus Avoscillospira avistercoris]